MKQNLSLFIAFLALIFSILSYYNSGKNQTSEKKHFRQRSEPEEKEIEIADLMLYIQHFHNKIYLSSKEKSKDLTIFYLNEMGEKMNEIAKANIWSNGVNISENMKIYGLKQIDILLTQSPEIIFQNFDNLTQACNSCHKGS